VSYAGSTGSGVTCWITGAEAGTIPTSPIITLGSPVTRNADVMTISGAPFTSFYNQAGGTLLWTGRMLDNASSLGCVAISDGTNGNRWQASIGTSPSRRSVASAAAVGQYDISGGVMGSVTIGELYSHIFAAQSGQFSTCVNGGTVSTQASGTLPGSMTRINIGADAAASGIANAAIRRIVYWPPGPAQSRIQPLSAL
jgi:hypothetical protein